MCRNFAVCYFEECFEIIGFELVEEAKSFIIFWNSESILRNFIGARNCWRGCVSHSARNRNYRYVPHPW